MPVAAVVPQSLPEDLAVVLASCREYYVELAIAGSAAYAGDIDLIILAYLSFDDVLDEDEEAALVVFVGAFAGID